MQADKFSVVSDMIQTLGEAQAVLEKARYWQRTHAEVLPEHPLGSSHLGHLCLNTLIHGVNDLQQAYAQLDE